MDNSKLLEGQYLGNLNLADQIIEKKKKKRKKKVIQNMNFN
jgi:hypothetical protein